MAATLTEEKTLVTSETEIADELTPSRREFVPYVVIVDGPHQGTRFPLREGENLVGRAPGCSVLLEDQSVSRQHLVITQRPDGWQIKDLDSKNGTHINGRPVEGPVMMGHGDVVQVGIYTLRLITQQVSVEEELAPVPENQALSTEASEGEEEVVEEVEVAEPMSSETLIGDAPSESEEDVAELEIIEEPEITPRRSWARLATYAAAVLLILGLSGYLATHFLGKKHVTPPPSPPSPTASQPVGQPQPPPPPLPPPGPKMIPVFLDFASSPLPARISFDGKDYGVTPVKVNMQLEVGKTYTADGIFKLDELQEDRTEHVSFTVQEDQSIIPILFRAPIGAFKVINLPKDVQLYVEGYFSYDQFHARPAKLTDVPYGKPLFFPYGRYLVELRQAKQLGDSPNYVEDIRYKREIFITEDNPNFSLDVTEKELSVFPVDVRTVPPKADLFVDATFVGKTPYKGDFPLGEHSLTIRKDGYFEETKSLKMDINTPYAVEILLKTTVAGEFLQKGKMALARGATQEAINQLSEALKQTPTAHETAQIQYLLGSCFFTLGNYSMAQSYYEQAKTDSEVKHQAMIGLVGLYHVQAQNDAAIPLLVDVMLNARDPEVKQQATAAFKDISPMRSIMYIASDPGDATISINDQALPQKTPAIVRDLGLGNYRIRITKDGYVPQDLKVDVAVTEFNPIIVKLKPIEK